jgi:hypothetical protein
MSRVVMVIVMVVVVVEATAKRARRKRRSTETSPWVAISTRGKAQAIATRRREWSTSI